MNESKTSNTIVTNRGERGGRGSWEGGGGDVGGNVGCLLYQKGKNKTVFRVFERNNIEGN